ncbi:hypothetical protein BJ508DRAFT_414294 [Ascobolus immersus RN42]|uniref:Methyltransferase domain-containing protein n=1 Tax=Ascobolus immersus RN42 TaxID=1160509 RepID=A0A3N4I851_ASCIM|nr:hypothetical protein BJ508DRAFT_414294 [Ascobolus immersus RN42]
MTNPGSMSEPENKDFYLTAISQRSKDVPWYYPPLRSLNPSALQILQAYSGIQSEEEAIAHVLRIREKAWQIFPYPCIGSYRFLDFSIHSNPLYPILLSDVSDASSPNSFLDLGCCFAQDIRRLIHDGASPSLIYGAELRPEFVELGEELFLDGDKEYGKIYTEVDVFEPSTLETVRGKDGSEFKYVHMAAFLHLWGLEKQHLVLKNVITHLLSTAPGSTLLGRQAGNKIPGEYSHPTNSDHNMFRHNPATFKKLFEEVGEELGVEWASVDVYEEGWGQGEDGEGRKVVEGHRETYFAGRDDTKLTFVVRRA